VRGRHDVAISLAVLDADLITTQTHAALTLAGLGSTIVAGPLLSLARRGEPVTAG